VRGISNADSGPPTLNARRRGTAVLIEEGVTVTLRDLGIVRGKARRGGGIVNLGSLTLMGVDVSRNHASVAGGGILNRGVLVVADESTIRGNRAAQGGGIVNLGTARLQGGSSVTRNVVTGSGGGVYNRGAVAMSAGSTIARNEAAAGGGLFDEGTVEGVVCAPEPEANVRNNEPDDCAVPAPPA
jgi:hypothetical protein